MFQRCLKSGLTRRFFPSLLVIGLLHFFLVSRLLDSRPQDRSLAGDVKHSRRATTFSDHLLPDVALNITTILANHPLAVEYSMRSSFWEQVHQQIQDERRRLRSHRAQTWTEKRAENLYFKRRPRKVNAFRYGTNANMSTACDSSVFLVILVHSKPEHSRRRDAIRNTWGSLARGLSWPREVITGRTKLMFVIGMAVNTNTDVLVKQEYSEHHDIILGNFTDSYRNMTLKSLLGLKWVSVDCKSATYMLKSDDDMFVNIPQILKILASKLPTRSVMGPHYPSSLVQRQGKWAVKVSEYPFERYPPYEAGSAYVVTCDIARELYESAEYVPQFHVDDVYITGVLGKIVQINHVTQPGFAIWSEKKPTVCQVLNPYQLTTTNVDPELMYAVWAALQSGTQC